nr:hypothetical protein [Actinomycetota bacterium]
MVDRIIAASPGLGVLDVGTGTGIAARQFRASGCRVLGVIHLPVHASWLDQCEIYFSIVQRKVVNPGDFTDTDQITD